MWVGGTPMRSRNRASWRARAAGTPSESSGSSSRWSPRLKVRYWRPRDAASSQAGRVTMRLALVRTPPGCAWTIPRLIPRLTPKPSRVTMTPFMASLARPAAGPPRAGRSARADIQSLLQDASDDIAAVEMLLGELACEPGVTLVVRLHGGKCLHRLVHVSEAKEPPSIRKDAAVARVLDDGRLAAGPVAEGPLADPRAGQGHGCRLRAAELAP